MKRQGSTFKSKKRFCFLFSTLTFACLFLVLFLSSFCNVLFSADENDAYKVTNATTTGITPLGTFQFGTIDTINLQNGNLILNIPILSLEGRGTDLNISLIYNSRIWRYHEPAADRAYPTWLLMLQRLDTLPIGWQLNIPKMQYKEEKNNFGTAYHTYTFWENGSPHNFTNLLSMDNNGNIIYHYSHGITFDSTYMTFDIPGSVPTNYVTKRDGTKIFFRGDFGRPSKYPIRIQDRNGNFIHFIMGNEEDKRLNQNAFLSLSSASDFPIPQEPPPSYCDPFEFIGQGPKFCFDPVPTLTIPGQEVQLYPWLAINRDCTRRICQVDPSELTWSSSNEKVAVVKNGKIKAIGSGTAEIYASIRYDDPELPKPVTIIGSTSVNVSLPQVTHLSISHLDNSAVQNPFVLCSPLYVKAILHFSDGSVLNITDKCQWESSDSYKISVTVNGDTALIRAGSGGKASITATYYTSDNQSFSSSVDFYAFSFSCSEFQIGPLINENPIFMKTNSTRFILARCCNEYCDRPDPDGPDRRYPRDIEDDEYSYYSAKYFVTRFCNWLSSNPTVATVGLWPDNPNWAVIQSKDVEGKTLIKAVYTNPCTGERNEAERDVIVDDHQGWRLKIIPETIKLIYKDMKYPQPLKAIRYNPENPNEFYEVTDKCEWSVENERIAVLERNQEELFIKSVSAGKTKIKASLPGDYLSTTSDIEVGDGAELLTSILDTLGRRIRFKYEYISTTNVDGSVYYTPFLSSIEFTDTNGNLQSIQFKYSQTEVRWNGRDWGTPLQNFHRNVPVLSEIILPNGLKYRFEYDGNFNQGRGQITSVILPTGGRINYTYGKETIDENAPFYDVVVKRTEINGDISNSWDYEYHSETSSDSSTKIKDPLGNITTVKYQGFGGYKDHILEVERSIYNSSGTLLKRITKEWDTQDNFPYPVSPQIEVSKTPVNPRVRREWITIYDSNPPEGYSVHYNYFINQNPRYCPDGNPIEIKEYKFVGEASIPLTLLRTTEREYLHTVNREYYNYNMLDLLSKEIVKDPLGNKVSETIYKYDEFSLASFQAVNHQNPLNGSYRGNLTRVQRKFSDSSYITTENYYDVFGNVIKTKDGKGNETNYTYTSSYQYAYPEIITNAKGHQTRNIYSIHTGALLSTIDPNGNESKYFYDSMGRLVRIENPDGGLTTYTYKDSPPLSIKTRVKISEGKFSESETIFDGFGRQILTRMSDPEGDVFTETKYDPLGRKFSESNPYRSGETKNFTTYEYDALDRIVRITHPDGNITQNDYSGYKTKTTDPTGRWREFVYDPLGNLLSVNENGLNTTSYEYDALGNLIRVNQGNRIRNFQYDYLGRLTSETHPESGRSNYLYDSNSNLTEKTDSRGIKTTYTYDSLNRITQITYTANTPQIFFFYDGDNPLGINCSNPKGRLTGISTERIKEAFSYDKMGRLEKEIKEIDGKRFEINYKYDLAGNLIEETYPSGRVVKKEINSAGRITKVRDETRGREILKDIKYTPFGAIKEKRYGNGILNTFQFNSRLQPVNIIHQNVLSLTYNYYDSNGKNNGNVISITDNLFPSKSTNYSYDGLNRLTRASSSTWSQTFSYDIYGNMLSKQGTGGAPSASFQYNEKNQILGFTYDSAGNLLYDGTRNYTYNAKNQIVKIEKGSEKWLYYYDSDGNRIIKEKDVLPKEINYYIYDQNGLPIAEYIKIGENPVQWKKDLIYLGSNLIQSSENPNDIYPPVISNIQVKNIRDRSVEITWATSEPSTSQVEYGTTLSYGSASPIDNQLVTSHSVTLTDLIPNTTYNFRVISIDAIGNKAFSPNMQFKTLPDTTPPVITDISVSNITQSSALITWKTDENSDSQVEYGLTTSYGNLSPLDSNLVKNHSITLSGLSSGKTYNFRVRSRDLSGNLAISENRTFTTLNDSTPPTKPVVIDDGATQSSTTTLHAKWSSSDPESGIVEYQYCIGTTPGGTDIVPWTSVGTNTEVTKTGLSLTHGTTYYFAVKARNGVGLWSEIGVSDGIRVVINDSTPPTKPVVTDDGAETASTTKLHAKWSSSDPESGIVEYQYCIGTTPGGTDIVPWTSVGTNTEITKTGLSLVEGKTYYFAVKAKNGVGLWSEVGVSDGITVKTFDEYTVRIYEGWGQSGTVSAWGGMNYAWIQVGYNYDDRYGTWELRGFCSFNTTSIPSNATIISARWYLYGVGVWNANYDLAVDAVSFPLPLPASAFDSGVIATEIAWMGKTGAGWVSASIPPQYIKKGGYTQFRLRTIEPDPVTTYSMVRYANSQYDPPIPSYIEIKYRVPRQQAELKGKELEGRQLVELMENQNLFNNLSKNQIPSSFGKGPNFDPPFETLLFSMNENEWKKKKPPRILLIKGKSLNPSTGEIEIETDDETKPEIDYGLTEDYGSKMEGAWNLKHRFIIPALKEGVYHFRVKAVDRDGNEVETLDQSLEIEGLIPPLLKDLFEEEKEIKERVFEPNQRWASKGGSWLSKYGKLFPYFKEEIEKEELEKPRPKVKRREEISILTTGETGWKDYSVEFKVRADYNQSKFGIAVRYNEENQSGYYLWIEQIKQNKAKLPLNYRISLERRLNGKSEILQQTIYTNNLKWFIIEMIVEGERIEVSVDGKKMIAVKDSEIGRGKVAIFSEQSLPLTVIDDFIVRALGKKGVLGKNINRNKIQFIAENSNSSSSPSIVYGLMSSISSPSSSRPSLSLSSRLSRFSSSTEKGPNEGEVYEIFYIPSNEEEEELIFPVGESDWAEYKVENKLKAMDIKGMAGVAVRYNEDGSGYFIWVKPEERVEIEEELSKWEKEVFKKDKFKRTILKSCRLILEKRGGGKGEIIIERLFMLKRWWEVKIEVDVGYGRILVKVDGEPITEISDEIKRGKIALIAKPKHFSPFDYIEPPLLIRREATEEEKGKESKELGYFISDWRWGLGGPSDYPLHYSYSEPDSEGAILYQTTTSLPPNEIVYYYHHDHLGNIRAVTDSNGNVVERHDFYPFGEEISQPTNKDSYLFTGKPRDSETGLDYFGARYYSSNLSRFLTPDQKSISMEKLVEPQEWNLYIYVGNNPLKYIDPSGLSKLVSLSDFERVIFEMLDSDRLKPRNGLTFCNVAVRETAQGLFEMNKENKEAFKAIFIKKVEKGKEYYTTASEIYNALIAREDLFEQVDEMMAQVIANLGGLVIAAQEGHVAIVAPMTENIMKEAEKNVKNSINNRGYNSGYGVYPIIANVGETNEVTFINWRFNKGKEWRFFVEKDTLRRISFRTLIDNFLKIYNTKWEYQFREGRLSIVIKSSGRAQQ